MSNAPEGHERLDQLTGTKEAPIHIATDVIGDHTIYQHAAIVCRANHVCISGSVAIVSGRELSPPTTTAARVVGTVTAYVRAERFEEE